MKARNAGSVLIGIILAAAAAAASASEVCTTAPREQWKPEAEARRATETLGYTVASVKADDGCYEVKAVDKNGRRFEIKYEPTEIRMVSRYRSKGDGDGRREASIASR